MSLNRVAVVSYHTSPLLEPGTGDAGGMTVYVREVADALADRGVGTDIFTRATASSSPVTVLRPGVRVVSVEAGPRQEIPKDQLTRYVDRFVAGARAFVTAQRIRYDALHSHYWQSGLAAAALRASWGVPWVHSQHTLARVKNQQLAPGDVPEPRARVEGEDGIMAAADVLIASTDDEWRQLSCLYGVPHDRLKTIHPGVDHDTFHPEGRELARKALGVGDEAMLVSAGRIQPLKGLTLAIEAVQRLRSMLDREVSLYIIGGPSGASGHEELARLRALTGSLGLSGRVRFVGAARHDDMGSFLKAADVALVCSHTESFGLVALEAHACGTPVVGTAVEGLSHIVRDGITGFLVDTRDPALFASRLERLLSDEAMRSTMGCRAVLVARRFSWETTAGNLLDLYDCLVHERWPQLCTC